MRIPYLNWQLYTILFLLFLPSVANAQLVSTREQQVVGESVKIEVAKALKDSVPLFTGFFVGTNLIGYAEGLWSPRIISPELSMAFGLKKIFFPTVEVGVASGEFTQSGRFFKILVQPYFRVGLDYRVIGTNDTNFFYIGLRYGISPMHYFAEWNVDERVHIKYEGPYTGQWGEGVAGLKVRISKHIAMGWNIRYRLLIAKESQKVPDYISGFGLVNENRNAISIQYSLYYRF